MFWQQASKVEKRGIREDVYFGLPNFFNEDKQYKIYSTWKIGPFELIRKVTQGHWLDTLGEFWVSEKRHWLFKIEREEKY